ncbi:hypothetical protein SCUP234_03773 [Seiridium cupressi]
MGSSSPQPLSRATLALIWAVLPGPLLLLLFALPLTTVLLPVLLVPTIGLFWWNQSSPIAKQADFQTLIWTYILTGTIGTTLVILVQSLLSYGFTMIISGSEFEAFFEQFGKNEKDLAEMDYIELASRRQMSRRWEYWAYLVFLSFGLAGLIEEYLKYTALGLARRYGRATKRQDFLIVTVAAVLGFSTIENIGFVYAAVQAEQPLGELIMTVMERVVVGPVGHSLPAILIGFNVIQREFDNRPLSLFDILREPVLFYGAADFMLFGISAINGNVGWIHPGGTLMYLMFALVFAMQIGFAFHVRRQLKSFA